jgi:hypothetical protein
VIKRITNEKYSISIIPIPTAILFIFDLIFPTPSIKPFLNPPTYAAPLVQFKKP